VEGRWGMNMRGTVDDNMKPIDDDFRRGISVKRAKRLFVISAMVSWGVFVGLSFALFYLGPYIRPPPVSFTCPVNSENDLICSGRGACPGVNGTVCLCPISWEGTTCERFAVGIVVFAIMVLGMITMTTVNAWRLYKPGSYDGSYVIDKNVFFGPPNPNANKPILIKSSSKG
jgi:hypothetical protein